MVPRIDAARATGWGLFLLALGLRLAYLVETTDNPLLYHHRLDEAVYLDFARLLAAGHWLGGDGPFHVDPLYGYLVGILFRVFGDNLVPLRLLQILLDAGTCVLIYRTGRHLWGYRPGLLAAAIYAAYPVAFYYSLLALKPTLVTFLAVWIIERAVHLRPASAKSRWFLLGLLCGVLVLGRSNFLLLPLFIAVLHSLALRPARAAALGAYAALAVGTLLVLSLALARNLYVSGEPLLVTANAGQVLYLANHPENLSGMDIAPPFVPHNNPLESQQYFRIEAERRLGRSLSPRQVSAYWTGQALAYMTANPGQALRAMGIRARKLVAGFEEPNNHSFYLHAAFSVLAWAPVPYFALVFALGAPGLLLGIGERRTAALVLAPILTVSATVLLFFAASRLRFPMVPFLALGAGVTLERGYRALRDRQWFFGLTLAAAVATLVWLAIALSPDHRILDQDRLALAWAYAVGDRPDRARELLADLAPRNQASPRFHEIRAWVALRQGLLEEAADGYEQAARLDPNSYAAHYTLGLLAAARGDRERAVAAFEQAHALRPNPDLACRLRQARQGHGACPGGELDIPATPGLQ